MVDLEKHITFQGFILTTAAQVWIQPEPLSRSECACQNKKVENKVVYLMHEHHDDVSH